MGSEAEPQFRLPQPIAALHAELGIDTNYSSLRGLPVHTEPADLVTIGLDVEWRQQRLRSTAAQQWRSMCAAAATQGVVLQVVSAFRSISYQADLIRAKLERGIVIDDIMAVNAAPGFSEHHSGRALDITTPGCEMLSEAFDTTAAFAWLRANAGAFDFTMTYPPGNAYGIAYEPWHWCYCEEDAID